MLSKKSLRPCLECWKFGIEDGNKKSFSFSLINVFELFFKMRMRIKNSIVWKLNSPRIRILISLLHCVMIHHNLHPIFILTLTYLTHP